MRDEIQRISKLVAEGKLSPEDAAILIDAFYESDRIEEREPQAEYAGSSATTPPPPPPPQQGAKGNFKDPLRGIVEQIEKLTKEGAEAVNWGEVAKQARESARKGLDAFKVGIEDLSKGKVHIGWIGNQESRDISLPLVVPSGKALRVENACGDVRITGGAASGTVSAHAVIRGSSQEDAKAKAATYTLIIEESDHQVVIRQPDVSGLSVDLEIRVMGAVPVDVKTESGDVRITGTGSSIRLSARSGDVRLNGLNGAIDLSTESGDVEVENSETPLLTIENKSGNIRATNIRGNMNVRTASGDVFASGAGKTISLESIQGDVEVDLLEPVTGSLSVRTVNGDARVTTPDGGDCRLSLSTLKGDVSCGLPLTDDNRSSHRITGRIGSGAGTFDVSAVTGDIAVELRDSVA